MAIDAEKRVRGEWFALDQVYANKHVRGEWFRLSTEDVLSIATRGVLV